MKKFFAATRKALLEYNSRKVIHDDWRDDEMNLASPSAPCLLPRPRCNLANNLQLHFATPVQGFSQKSLNAFRMHWNLLIGESWLLARRGAVEKWNNRNKIGFPLFLTRWHLPICMQYAMTISFLIPASTRRFIIILHYSYVVCTLVDKYAQGKLKAGMEMQSELDQNFHV